MILAIFHNGKLKNNFVDMYCVKTGSFDIFYRVIFALNIQQVIYPDFAASNIAWKNSKRRTVGI